MQLEQNKINRQINIRCRCNETFVTMSQIEQTICTKICAIHFT